MKPFTSLGHHHSLFSRHGGHHSQDDHHHHPRPPISHTEPTGHHSQPMGTVSSSEQGTTAEILHRAFTEVPDYSIASRGFIGGGVPPLESMRGLPSYEEAARGATQEATSVDMDLAAGVAQVCLGSDNTDDSHGVPTDERPSRLEHHSGSAQVDMVPSPVRT
jgi:hypothetical protein